MIDLVSQIITKITELTAGLTYDHKPTGEKKPVQVIDTFLPPRDSSWQEGGEYPLIRVAHYKGAYLSQNQTFEVVVLAGIYTAGDIAAGTAAIKELAAAIGKLTQSRLIGNYRLDTPINYQFGDNSRGAEGIQPHPYHYVTFYLQLTSA
jgi:hypothetical protein